MWVLSQTELRDGLNLNYCQAVNVPALLLFMTFVIFCYMIKTPWASLKARIGMS